MEFIRIQSLVTLISHIFFIGLSFWGLQSLRIQHFFKKNKVQQVRIFYVLLAVALGFILSSFFMDFLTHSQNLIYFFQ
jgi:uncharacterized integral membrane protein (TIGR02327 family)